MNSIYLRELVQDDLPRLNEWRHNREIISNLGAAYRYIGPEVENQWFECYLNQRQTNIRLAICQATDHLYIGNVYLLNLDLVHRQAEFSILIGDLQAQNKGYGYEATLKMLYHGFYDLNLNRIELQVVENNHRAMALYRKCGFKEEGRRRQAVYKEGQYRDMLLFSLLKDEFEELSKQLSLSPINHSDEL